MYIKMTRLARAGNIGSFGAIGCEVAACARLRSARYPNPHERDCSIWRRFMALSSIAKFGAGEERLVEVLPRGDLGSYLRQRRQLAGRATHGRTATTLRIGHRIKLGRFLFRRMH